MIHRAAVNLLLLLCSGTFLFTWPTAQTHARTPTAETTVATQVASGNTNAPHQISPGPVDGQIANITARLLERYHYLRPHIDSTVSSKFLDRYLETLDPQHLHFLQSDLAQFEVYRTNLDRMTLPERGATDTRPACEIFNRFVQRFQQRVDYVDQLLRNEKLTFDADERIVLNRKDLPYPKDFEEAKQLWRDRLRFEYLQEKLGKLDAKKKAAAKTESTDNSTETKAPDKPRKTETEEIVDTLSHRYHRNLHTFTDWDNDDVLQVYLTALAHVFDPHSDYFGRSALDSFAITMNLSLFGIGAELTSEDGYCTIHRLLPNGPAEKSKKIAVNDRIIAVAQSNQPPVDVVDMSLSKAVQLIRGPKGTEVRLTVIPAGADASARKNLTLIRDEIKLEDQEAKAKIIELPGSNGASARLGVIDLSSFYASFDPSSTREKSEPRSTTADVARLLTKLRQENVSGVILDLRRNGGGSLEEAIRLTGLFIKEGPVVQVKDFDGSVKEEDTPPNPPVLYEGPLIVLTSRFSASASEILAGALQDYGRALIVGDASTHGKGTVQSVQPLRLRGSNPGGTDPGALKLTIKKFYRPSGASTQLKGVVPDIVLPSLFNESKEIGESALENPLAWDTIEKSKFDRVNLVEPYLPELRRRSTERVNNDKEFAYIREDIAVYNKKQADKSFSLNEKRQLQEREEAEARQKARDKERLASGEPQEKTYELSLKQAALPGLPPPMARTNSNLARLSGTRTGASSGVSTNGTIAAAPGAFTPTRDPASSALEDTPDEEKPPAVDADLLESERILLDYISLLRKNNVASALP
ncbi:MAG TPA: carboxy terminal-processing peptidase [Candidatus Limnocylindrales bacterium]|nr:carboxy terminal-processing peptidase [Candidatus Limnocylindrales bacterium]